MARPNQFLCEAITYEDISVIINGLAVADIPPQPVTWEKSLLTLLAHFLPENGGKMGMGLGWEMSG
jgi:hypothetical protein